jgi:hypothetical protein
MTPQEKAVYLLNSFEDDLMECDTYFLEQAKKRCALIAVEEILKRTRSVDTMPPNCQKIDENTKEYWQQVKTKIEKL